MKILRALLTFCAWIFLFCSCNDPETSLAEKNMALAKRSFEAFNKHNWDEHASFFSDTCKYLDPSYGPEYKIVNRKDKSSKYKEMEIKSPDIKDEITDIFASGDKVVVQFISSGTAQTEQGPYKWSLPICCVFTFEKGLIVSDATYYNRGK
ncbi:MAG: nuclear transport factor 2 family protein [Bacteroidota bacterium]